MTTRRQNRDLAARQAAELQSWRRSEGQREPLRYFIDKLGLSPVLFELIDRYRDAFEGASNALELGAGTGWASCMIKHLYPDLHVTATDISPDAIAKVEMWQRVFDVHLDETRVALSYDTGAASESLELVFAFASAHHFVLHRRTLQEIARVLRPGGIALYLHEPSCPDYLYLLAAWRMRRTRSDVVEDTLKRRQIVAFANAAGLDCEIELDPSAVGRGPLGVVYNTGLNTVPPLRRYLPCGANFKFTKRA